MCSRYGQTCHVDHIRGNIMAMTDSARRERQMKYKVGREKNLLTWHNQMCI